MEGGMQGLESEIHFRIHMLTDKILSKIITEEQTETVMHQAKQSNLRASWTSLLCDDDDDMIATFVR